MLIVAAEPYEVEGSAEHSSIRHGLDECLAMCGEEEFERRARAMDAFVADMRPYREAGYTTAQASAAVRRACRVARAGSGLVGRGDGDSDGDSSDGGGDFGMASDEYEY